MAQGVKPAEAGVVVGQVFLGKYRVDAILGHGGMGVVAECTHLALNERVAIKMLRQDVLTDSDAVSRFLREAQAAVKLKSEYVARVSDVGTFENGVPYMVMEYLDGQDLGELLKHRGVLPVQWATELILQTAEALAEAHSLGIVHRDVKPTNLFVTWRPDGTSLVKVLDFGISKSPMGTDMQLTQTQSLLGTPAYMSPEQMRSARLVDTRTDIWSLGTVFYEVLEGRRPFEAESFSEMCVKVAVDAPSPMVNTPVALQPVILRCLAKTPEQRYASMADLARDLIPFANDQHAASRLVERMTRMLRRSAMDWEGGSTGVGRKALAPHHVIDPKSGAVRAQTPPQGWSIGSDPAIPPYHQPTPAPAPLHQPQMRYATPETMLSTMPTRPRRWPIVVVMLLLICGGGFAAWLAGGGGGEDISSKAIAPVEPAKDTTPPPAKATEPPTETPTAPAPVPAPVVEAKQPEVKQPEVKQPEVKQPEVKQPKHPPVVANPNPNKNPKHQSTGPTKEVANKQPDEVKKVETTPAAGSAAPQPKCDPFGSMHGCK